MFGPHKFEQIAPRKRRGAMRYVRRFAASFAIVSALSAAGAVDASCPAIDFEDLAIGTAVTTQYDGVTFSVVPQSCAMSPEVQVCVVEATGGTSSGGQALRIDEGCPLLSPDYIVMEFEELQREVSFTVGEGSGLPGLAISVRVYGDESLLQTMAVQSAGGVNRLVHAVSTDYAPQIRRIEVEAALSGFEVIDDLSYDVDPTPPIAAIAGPTFRSCGCGLVSLVGVACDPDGAYEMDMLEYRKASAPAQSPWTLVGTASSPLCEPGTLYTWDTTGLEHGDYYLRMTVFNECGVASNAVTVVFVDKAFDVATIRTPADGDVIAGDVCIDGTMWDELCFDRYTVEYRPASGGAFLPVDTANPEYYGTVSHDPIATWATASGVADGDYVLRAMGADNCDNWATETVSVTVDNTRPIAEITSPEACAHVEGSVEVRGTAADANIESWTLEYASGDSGEWTEIASGEASVEDAVLGVWDTTDLPLCAYTLRLRAADKALAGCGRVHAHVAERTLSVTIGDCGNFDADDDGDVDLADYAAFVRQFTGPAQ
jgi:hypothetical protein